MIGYDTAGVVTGGLQRTCDGLPVDLRRAAVVLLFFLAATTASTERPSAEQQYDVPELVCWFLCEGSPEILSVLALRFKPWSSCSAEAAVDDPGVLKTPDWRRDGLCSVFTLGGLGLLSLEGGLLFGMGKRVRL